MKQLRTFKVYVLVRGVARIAYRGCCSSTADRVLGHLLICGEDAWMTSASMVMESEAVIG